MEKTCSVKREACYVTTQHIKTDILGLRCAARTDTQSWTRLFLYCRTRTIRWYWCFPKRFELYCHLFTPNKHRCHSEQQKIPVWTFTLPVRMIQFESGIDNLLFSSSWVRKLVLITQSAFLFSIFVDVLKNKFNFRHWAMTASLKIIIIIKKWI